MNTVQLVPLDGRPLSNTMDLTIKKFFFPHSKFFESGILQIHDPPETLRSRLWRNLFERIRIR